MHYECATIHPAYYFLHTDPLTQVRTKRAYEPPSHAHAFRSQGTRLNSRSRATTWSARRKNREEYRENKKEEEKKEEKSVEPVGIS